MYLKKLNLLDAKKEYIFFQNNKALENSFENEYKNISFEKFISKSIPERLNAEKELT